MIATPSGLPVPPPRVSVSSASPPKPTSTPASVAAAGRSPVISRNTTSHSGTLAMSSAARPLDMWSSATPTMPFPPVSSNSPTSAAVASRRHGTRSTRGPFLIASTAPSSTAAVTNRRPALIIGGIVCTTKWMPRYVEPQTTYTIGRAIQTNEGRESAVCELMAHYTLTDLNPARSPVSGRGVRKCPARPGFSVPRSAAGVVEGGRGGAVGLLRADALRGREGVHRARSLQGPARGYGDRLGAAGEGVGEDAGVLAVAAPPAVRDVPLPAVRVDHADDHGGRAAP